MFIYIYILHRSTVQQGAPSRYVKLYINMKTYLFRHLPIDLGVGVGAATNSPACLQQGRMLFISTQKCQLMKRRYLEPISKPISQRTR